MAREGRSNARRDVVSSEARPTFDGSEGAFVPDDAQLWRYRTFVDSYRGLWRVAYRVAFRLLGDRDQAALVAQEACLQTCIRWRKLGRAGIAMSWTARTSGDIALELVPDDMDPSGSFGGERIDLARAIAGLPKRARAVALLRYVAEIPDEEIATLLGCSVDKVDSRGTRAGDIVRNTIRREVA